MNLACNIILINETRASLCHLNTFNFNDKVFNLGRQLFKEKYIKMLLYGTVQQQPCQLQ